MKLRVDFGKEIIEYDVEVRYDYLPGGDSHYVVSALSSSTDHVFTTGGSRLNIALNNLAKQMSVHDAG